MKVVLAILAMALATLTWQPVLANPDDVREPTMTDLQREIASVLTRLNDMDGKLNTLQTTANDLATKTALQSLTAKVDSHASRGEQMAMFMVDPSTTPSGLYLIGQSTIPGFPPGPKDAHGRIGQPRPSLNPAMKLPAGSYLIELQQPRTDNVACIHSVTQRTGIPGSTNFGQLRSYHCPSIRLYFGSNRGRLGTLMDGAGIYTTDGTESFKVQHQFPPGFTFSTDKPRPGYIGAMKVTKIK